MRVTESRMLEIAQDSLGKARESVARKGEQLSSGMRVARASDDVASWAEGIRARTRLAQEEAFGGAIKRTRERLYQAEGALETIGDVMRRVTELAVQSANETTGTWRSTAAVEVRNLMATAIQAANMKAEDGEYLFSTFSATSAPFSSAGVYSGTTAARQVDVATGQRIQANIPGSRLTVSSGVDVFDVLGDIATAMEAGDRAAVAAELDRLAQARDQVNLARGELGGYTQALDAADQAREGVMETLIRVRSRAVDIDAIRSATELAQAKNTLESAQVAAEEIFQVVGRITR
ncbi:MAG: hypothetical protein HY698_08185 [Deltaproteobacteria bacterium]|nr:hypothetical protein [Deltaproteobacteria bacterium]